MSTVTTPDVERMLPTRLVALAEVINIEPLVDRSLAADIARATSELVGMIDTLTPLTRLLRDVMDRFEVACAVLDTEGTSIDGYELLRDLSGMGVLYDTLTKAGLYEGFDDSQVSRDASERIMALREAAKAGK